MNADVVVVGAGLSGLTVAKRLTESGADVIVLEAKDRVGGRTLQGDLPHGKSVDLGGRFVGPGQDEVLALAEEMGVERFDVFAAGDAVWHFDGERIAFAPDADLPIGAAGVADYNKAVAELDRLAATIDPAAPWASPDAERLDRTSAATWLDATIDDPAARFVMETYCTIIFCVPPWRLSLLQILVYLASCGGWDANVEGEQWRFVGGSYEISARIAAELGDRVHLGTPVRRIERTGGEVRVVCDELTVAARRCVVAMSPGDARYIEFAPMLPTMREYLHRHFQMESAVAMHLVYETPFWREDGLSGVAFGDLPGAGITWDSSPPDGEPGVILTFQYRIPEGSPVGQPLAIADDKAARRQSMIDALVDYFGPAAASPIDYVEKEWRYEPYTHGCQSGMPPGLYTEVGSALKDPVDGIYWSSTELGAKWFCWMNGAVESGERVAREVAADLDLPVAGG
ncbi:MAG: FAD-dependent oxidoreductase [Actinobacteria bacterium]|nr:FAD-dependent oxidoreductase [Actinomycetota bacterium]